jgi:hypothetical protein
VARIQPATAPASESPIPFRDELASDAAAPGSECRAQGDLSFALDCPRKQKARHVSDREEQTTAAAATSNSGAGRASPVITVFRGSTR